MSVSSGGSGAIVGGEGSSNESGGLLADPGKKGYGAAGAPLRISYYLAALLPISHQKQVHFEGFCLKRVAI